MRNGLVETVASDRARKTFYPTPRQVAEKLLKDVEFRNVRYILEPSAGKGDLLRETVAYKHTNLRRKYGLPFDYPESKYDWKEAWSGIHADCIEIDPALRQMLEENGMRVIHDDFLTFETQMRYDLCVMNPPFDQGADHLLKALDLMKRGGQIACILNAETIRNPYSYKREELLKLLNQYGAHIRYLEKAFSDAERQTDVDVALVTVSIPAATQRDSTIIDEMHKAPTYKSMEAPEGVTSMVQYNAIQEWVNRFDFEVACGLRMIDEFKALRFSDEPGDKPLLSLGIGSKSDNIDLNNLDSSKNTFIRETRRKYWNKLFMQPVITERFTSNILNELRDNVNRLADYEFSVFNILTMIIKYNAKAIKGIEDTIVELFDKWTASYWHEASPNRHYFNGWCTNDCFRINKKVIISFYAYGYNYGTGKEQLEGYKVREYLEDIEKTLDYLDGGRTEWSVPLRDVVEQANKENRFRNVETKFFFATFYKKGTAHLVFKDMDLLEKFNMFAAQKKGWLPPEYGRKRYKDMDKEAQHVVDSFQGQEKYEEVMARADYFLNAGTSPMMMLGTGV